MTRSIDDSADAFGVLSDEPLSFSRLRERTGVRNSGRFNYHLRKLCECFVRETDGGYELGHAGSRVVAATVAADGSAAGRDAPDETAAVDDTDECPVCGESDCGKLFHVHLSPPWRDE